MTQLSSNQRRHLRALAHHLKPLVSVGRSGVTPGLLAEVKRCLADHELIKIRVDVDERDERAAIAEELATAAEAALVQTIGMIAVLYKEGTDKVIRLPAAKSGLTGGATTVSRRRAPEPSNDATP